METDPIEMLSYCGLYCGACPSYNIGTCLGCRSEDKNQKRTSKWGCKIRKCCINEKEVSYCGECSEFTCSKLSKKLLDPHREDPRYNYRFEIPDNIKEINAQGYEQWIKAQKEKWRCDQCGAPIVFYKYNCIECEKNYNPKELK
jgi:hypothetical protein